MKGLHFSRGHVWKGKALGLSNSIKSSFGNPLSDAHRIQDARTEPRAKKHQSIDTRKVPRIALLKSVYAFLSNHPGQWFTAYEIADALGEVRTIVSYAIESLGTERLQVRICASQYQYSHMEKDQ